MGTMARAQQLVAIVTIAWLAMGFDMAFQKAQLGPKVGWIGYEIEDTPTSTFVQVKKEFMDDLWHDTKDILARM